MNKTNLEFALKLQSYIVCVLILSFRMCPLVLCIAAYRPLSAGRAARRGGQAAEADYREASAGRA